MINQLKSGLSGEIFVDKNTAFVVEKYNQKDLIEKEIGDSKTPDKFIPQQKITRWDNEANVSIRLVHDEKTPNVVVEGDDVVWKGQKVEARFYDVFNTEHPEGAGEFEVVLKEKPATNVVEFTVVDKDVEYSYQPALTPEEIEQGASRPENVVGSYAVYAKTPKTNWTGGKEYKCGKIGHIFRPKIIDSARTEVWGDLHIENGILSVTIPQEFLDKAVYPVRHAAGLTFGYTTLGATPALSGADVLYMRVGTIATGALVTSISFGARNNADGNDAWVGAIYDNSLALISPQSGAGSITSNTAAFFTVSFSGPTLSAGTYYVAALADGTAGNGHIRMSDAGGTSGDSKFNNSVTYPTWPDPFTGTNTTNKYSLYATYTAADPSYQPRMGFIMHNNPAIA